MQLKTVGLAVKSAGPDDGLGEGEFLGYASVFDNKDSYGDIVRKGAFLDSLSEWEKAGAVIPALWGHDMYDPFSNVGEVLTAEEDDHGLKVHVRFDLENPKAKQVYRLVKGRRVSQMSFAYDVLEGSYIESKDDDGKDDSYYELRKLKLYEVSVVPIGANQETEILGVKAAQMVAEIKAGRVLSTKNEGLLLEAYNQLTAAAQQIGDVLGKVSEDTEEGKASAEPSVKSEEPAGANDEEPAVESASAESSEDEDDEILMLELETLELVNHETLEEK